MFFIFHAGYCGIDKKLKEQQICQYYLLELAWWRHDMETLLLLMTTGAYVPSNAELRSKYRCQSEQTV